MGSYFFLKVFINKKRKAKTLNPTANTANIPTSNIRLSWKECFYVITKRRSLPG